jgi:tetratricopeptide (TPR) repeat protein
MNSRLLLAALIVLVSCGLTPALLAQEGWRVAQGKESRIRTDLPETDAQAVAKRVDEYCEIFAAFYGGLGLVPRQQDEIAVHLFGRFDDFTEFREKDNSKTGFRGYSSPSLNAIITYYDPKDPSLASKLFGLCSNMYLRRYVENPPEWLRRGLDAYFTGYEATPGRPAHKAEPLCELLVLQDALKKDKYLPLQQLLKRNKETFGDRPATLPESSNLLPNAEAWGLVHYLVDLAPDPEREMFGRFLKAMNAKGAKADSAALAVPDWEKFEKTWSAAILAIDPKCDSAEKWMRVGDGYGETMNWYEAVDAYQNAYKLKPATPSLHYKAGYCSKRRGDYPTAIWWLENAIKMDAKDPQPHYLLGRIYAVLDWKATNMAPPKADPAKALEQAKAAVDLSSTPQPMYLAFLGRCQALNGDKKTALVTMKKAIDAASKEDKDRYEKELAEVKKVK